MSGIVNKVKEVLHKDHSTTGHSTTGHSTTGHSTTGHSTNAGPHNSNIANAADPRVDSDNSRYAGGNSGVTGGYTGAGTGIHSTSGSTNAGPHSSNLVNAADPRIDSDNSRITHGNAGHSTTGGYGASHSTNTTAGPHDSNVANKLDPRVDSDLDGSRNLGAAEGNTGYSGSHLGNNSGGHTGFTGGVSHSTNAGPHDGNLGNKLDPRVDSDLDGRGNRHGAATGGILGASGSHATAGSGTAQNTAGPHNSDMLNKVDPRVDSNRDGSKTYGGNQTHA
jgi:hypothetical protein